MGTKLIMVVEEAIDTNASPIQAYLWLHNYVSNKLLPDEKIDFMRLIHQFATQWAKTGE